MHIDVEHESLLNVARYSDLKCLKKLYRNLENLYKLATMGNRAAVVIWVDLTMALEQGDLTDKQLQYLTLHLLEGESLREISEDYEITETSVDDSIQGALKRIQKFLATRYAK